MSEQLVFVYGSLRSGGANEMSVSFPDATYVGEGNVRGKLYDLGAYPGLLLANSGLLVTGELYEVTDETLAKLDQFELTSDYERREVDVDTGTEQRRSWIYVPAQEVSDHPLIESGDWIKHLGLRGSR